MKYQVAGHSFARKEDIDAFVVNLRDKYPKHAKITGVDAAFLTELLSCHPDAHQKLGRSISHFTVGFNRFGTRCFFIIYEDGSKDDFSFKDCIRQVTPAQ